jgi:tetratricopeptide (TPR) repeat protein
VQALRLSEVAGDGDATRRASTRLVLQGLDADAAARPLEAVRLYERALQVDATNPWAYLALARYHAEEGTASLTFSYLDKAEALLGAQRALSPQVEPHLVGLRGEALLATGRAADAAPLLERARLLSPSVWDDGHLAPAELR